MFASNGRRSSMFKSKSSKFIKRERVSPPPLRSFSHILHEIINQDEETPDNSRLRQTYIGPPNLWQKMSERIGQAALAEAKAIKAASSSHKPKIPKGNPPEGSHRKPVPPPGLPPRKRKPKPTVNDKQRDQPLHRGKSTLVHEDTWVDKNVPSDDTRVESENACFSNDSSILPEKMQDADIKRDFLSHPNEVQRTPQHTAYDQTRVPVIFPEKRPILRQMKKKPEVMESPPLATESYHVNSPSGIQEVIDRIPVSTIEESFSVSTGDETNEGLNQKTYKQNEPISLPADKSNPQTPKNDYRSNPRTDLISELEASKTPMKSDLAQEGLLSRQIEARREIAKTRKLLSKASREKEEREKEEEMNKMVNTLKPDAQKEPSKEYDQRQPLGPGLSSLRDGQSEQNSISDETSIASASNASDAMSSTYRASDTMSSTFRRKSSSKKKFKTDDRPSRLRLANQVGHAPRSQNRRSVSPVSSSSSVTSRRSSNHSFASRQSSRSLASKRSSTSRPLESRPLESRPLQSRPLQSRRAQLDTRHENESSSDKRSGRSDSLTSTNSRLSAMTASTSGYGMGQPVSTKFGTRRRSFNSSPTPSLDDQSCDSSIISSRSTRSMASMASSIKTRKDTGKWATSVTADERTIEEVYGYVHEHLGQKAGHTKAVQKEMNSQIAEMSLKVQKTASPESLHRKSSKKTTRLSTDLNKPNRSDVPNSRQSKTSPQSVSNQKRGGYKKSSTRRLSKPQETSK